MDKKIAMIIAYRDFRDIEYFIPKQIFEAAGIEITTVSTDLGTAIGADGGDTEATVLISELDVADFDALMFVGGPGMVKHLDDEIFHSLAQQTIQANKVLGAICIAPAMLAKAGLLENKKATVWSSSMDKSAVKTLKENKAIYQDKLVVVDKNIITGNGPDSAQEFAETLTEMVK